MSNFDFSNACVCFNGDPYVAENEDEFEDICKRLDSDWDFKY